MIKIVFCLRRLPGFTHEEFLRYWHEVHAPLVRKHAQALRIVRYVQLHTDLGPVTEKLRALRHSPEPYDGIAEVWYESFEAMAALKNDAAASAATRALLEDEQRFLDLPRSPMWLGHERVIIAG